MRLIKRRFMIMGPRWRELSLGVLALALVIAVCGIASESAAGATPHGCESATAVDTVSAKVQMSDASVVLTCYGEDVLRPIEVGLLPPSADAESPGSPFSEPVSVRAPPLSF